jgi:hypothetical protein
MESVVVKWVECSKCEKWRIIHPLPDGSEEIIPDIWFCDMNRDPLHNTCDAPEEEYKAPEIAPVALPNLNRAPRPAKSNDPDSIRAKLRLLTNEDLQAAYEALDLERLFKEEFGDNLETARSSEFHPQVVPQKPVTRGRAPSNTRREVDVNATSSELKHLSKKGISILPQEISTSFTKHLR